MNNFCQDLQQSRSGPWLAEVCYCLLTCMNIFQLNKTTENISMFITNDETTTGNFRRANVYFLGAWCKVEVWTLVKFNLLDNTWCYFPPYFVCLFQVEGFFQPPTDQFENQVVTDKTQRNRGAPLTPVRNGNDCDPSFSSIRENEPEERFSDTSETQLLSSPEGSMVFSSSQSSPYRSQDMLPRVEKPSKSDLGNKQEKTSMKSLYISLNMFEQSDVRWALWQQNTRWS